METSMPECTRGCSRVIPTRATHVSPTEPFQLSFLSPLPGATAGQDESPYEGDREYIDITRRLRRRRCRSLKREDVERANAQGCAVRDRAGKGGSESAGAGPDDKPQPDTRTLLRTPSGEFLPPLYARNLVIGRGGDVFGQSDTCQPANADTIIDSAEALLSSRLHHGVKILRDPYLLLRFLRMRLVSQPQPVFAAFFLDRKQRLIRFTELARGSNDRVSVYTREVVREALACNAEQVLCVRSDPLGDHEPTVHDIDDARRVKQALDLLVIPLLDYVIVGQSVTSLLQRGVI
jgi:DNA repair protein RadC